MMRSCEVFLNVFVALGLGVVSVFGDTQVEPEMALEMLRSQDEQFEQKVVKVTDEDSCGGFVSNATAPPHSFRSWNG